MAKYAGKTGGKRYQESQKAFHQDSSGMFETTNLTAADVGGLIEIREDNRQAFSSALNKALVSALEKVGLAAEGYAKRLCPVDTGRLRNSITHQVNEGEKAVLLGTNVEYAIWVELGARGKDGQPFLVPAAENHESEYAAIFRAELGG